ncbi:TonB-dependent receptor [Denitratisoma oestradiolicum]|uniref:TonB-dependent receptor n=1 Tax=Denitratisoma oestradiolicum TaxID=311182 RepID=A0A6S6XY44_9PROT|nr:TonB-dependent receptor [Denitratisoma oestradiolicum]TWO80040.1 TonB-dependent receptor [Denitratisoma oestradiolicum]CAB1369811.1 TonB-dependent receptor [Denitratisoma oestradiolicum]
MRRIHLAVLMALPFGAWAADEIVMPTVRVRDQALYDPLEARRQASGNTATLLSVNPGLSLYSGGGVSSLPAIHGLADDRIKIRVDGAEITSACGNHMNPPLSYMDPSRVDRMEVLAGITPVSQGGDSIVGTIAVASSRPVFARAGEGLRKEGSLSLKVRSVNNGTAAAFSAAVASDSLSLGYGASVDRGESYQDGKGRKVLDTLYESHNQSLTLGLRGDNDEWTLRLGEQRIPYQGYPNQYMDMVGNHGVSANLGYSGRFGWGRLDARFYWQDTEHRMGFFTQEKSGKMPMNTRGQDIGYRVQGEFPLASGDKLHLGHELHRHTLDDWWPPVAGTGMSPNTYVNLNNGRRDRLAFFAEWDARLDARWSGQMGLRDEVVKTDVGDAQPYSWTTMMQAVDAAAARAFNGRDRSRRDNNLDITVLVRYEADPAARYEFGYARKTRSPNLYERYSWGRGTMAMRMIGWFGDGNGYVGDMDLKPEVAHTLSATATWKDAGGEAWEVKLAPYYSYVRNYIDVDVLGSFVPYSVVGNTASLLRFANHDARIHGFDLSWSALAWRSAVYGEGQFTGRLAYVRGKRTDGGDLYHVMPLNLSLGLEQTVGAWSKGVDVQLVERKFRVDERRHESATGGYGLVNLNASYQWTPAVRLSLGIGNLFDRYYELPLGGTNLAGLKATARGPLGVVPGAGRSIDLGLALKF